MKFMSLITAAAFLSLSLSLHVTLEHGGSGSNGFAAVQDTHHGDDEAGGERSDYEHSNHTPPHHDSDSHQHDAALMRLKTKPLVQHVLYAFAAAGSLVHSSERDTHRRTEPSAPAPPRISVYLSTQTLLL